MQRMRSFIKGQGVIFIALAVAFALIVLSLFGYKLQSNLYIDEDMYEQVDAIQANCTRRVSNELDYLRRLTISAAQFLRRTRFENDAQIVRALRDYVASSNLSCALFVSRDGVVYTDYSGYLGPQSTDAVVDGLALSQLSFNGTNAFLLDPFYFEALDAPALATACVTTVGGMQGKLVSCYDLEQFSRLLQNNFLGGTTKSGIVDKSGRVVLGDSADEFGIDIFSPMENIPFSCSSLAQMRQDFAEGNAGLSRYTSMGVDRYCSYAPIPNSDWFIISTVRESALRQRHAALEKSGGLLSVSLISIMTALLIIIVAVRLREQREIQKVLQRAAMLDGLTGIYNRGAAETLIADLLSTRSGINRPALMVIDIDDFKGINDTYGHIWGDLVLRACAQRMQQVFGEHDVVARIGGDEFMVLLKNGRDEAFLSAKAQELLDDLHLCTDSGKKHEIFISIGIALPKQPVGSFRELYEMADAALYRAKQGGKRKYSF